MNDENLIPAAHKLTVEEQSRGGKASGKSRRKKKSMKQAAELLLHLPSNQEDDSQMLSDVGLDADEEATNMLIVVAAIIKAAKSGDVKATRVLMDITGTDYYKNEYLKLRKAELKLKQQKAEDDW
ncbi:MAG: hypothetical protein IJJ69_08610 [Oscillospiraceae bacterium]|nr:hypothetical protein [Oscillospiraceae bacterium]